MFFYLFIAMIFPIMLQESPPLQSFQWENRIILLHGNKKKVSTQQESYMQNKEELADRDLILIMVKESEVQFYPSAAKINIDAQTLISYYQLNHKFTSILIGKDGEVKSCDYNLLQPQEYFSKIDSMPMRRAEMRKKNQWPNKN